MRHNRAHDVADVKRRYAFNIIREHRQCRVDRPKSKCRGGRASCSVAEVDHVPGLAGRRCVAEHGANKLYVAPSALERPSPHVQGRHEEEVRLERPDTEAVPILEWQHSLPLFCRGGVLPAPWVEPRWLIQRAAMEGARIPAVDRFAQVRASVDEHLGASRREERREGRHGHDRGLGSSGLAAGCEQPSAVVHAPGTRKRMQTSALIYTM